MVSKVFKSNFNNLYRLIKINVYDFLCFCLIRDLRKKFAKKVQNYKKCNVPVLFINLERSPNRRQDLLTELNIYFHNITRINAVDGNLIKNNLLKNRIQEFHYNFEDFNEFSNTPGVIGCLLSHYRSLLTVYHRNDEFALVLEDDACLEHITKWKFTIDEIIKKAPKDFDLIKLHSYRTLQNLKELRKGKLFRKIDNPPNKEFSAAALLWSKKGILKKLKHLDQGEFVLTRDVTNTLVADYFLFDKIECYDLTIPTITTKDVESLISKNNHQQLRMNRFTKTFYN